MKVADFFRHYQLGGLIQCGIHAVSAIIVLVLLLVVWVIPQVAGIGVSSQQAKQMASNVQALQPVEESQLFVYQSDVLSSQEAVKALKVILRESQGVTLKEFKTLSTMRLGSFYQHNLQLALTGSYEALMSYFKRLSEDEPRFYWDSIRYQVANYPEANVEVKLSVVNKDKQWVGAV